ncbi:hypothetical protein HY029_05945 [Candidatus Gottesmanbacteria bacterium]|nr:hypothetical protein [Candidatus Gottesmanbacteria bacterium]
MKDQKQNIKTDSILSRLNPQIAREVETWIVNSVKVKMIKKMDTLLETEGKINTRKLFLVPIFNISDMKKRVEEQAPELKTLFYKELLSTLSEAEGRLI